MVGNPMLSQVRDFIETDDAPPALDPVGIVRRALRGRERRVAILTLLVALLAATVAYLAIKPSYQSSGMLRVLPTEGKILYSDSDDSRLRLYDAFVTAEMQLLTSRPILEAALEHLHVDHDHSFPIPNDVGDLAAMVQATGKKGLISLAARSGNPRLSAAAVNSVIAAYEESNEAARRRNYDVRREELRSRETELEKNLAVLKDEYLLIGREHDAGTLSKAHVAKTAQLEVLEERLAELDNAIAQLQSTGGVSADVGNSIEIQRATLLDQAMAEMTYERAQRLATLETLKGRYRPSHPKLRSALRELEILEGAIDERRDQIAMLGKAGALTGSGSGADKETMENLQLVKDRLLARRQSVRSEAADLNTKLIRIRGIATEKDRLEQLLAETKRALDEVLVESHNDLSRAIEIIALGKVPKGPIEDKRKPAAVGGLVFGGLGTLALFIGGTVLAGRVRFSDDLDVRSTEVLATVVAQQARTRDNFADAARKLRNELDLRWPQREAQPLVIGVAGTGEAAGATSIACALGAHYSSAGRKVLLVDVDPRGNGLSRLFATTKGPGAPAVARGKIRLAESVRKLTDGKNNMDLLPAAGNAALQGTHPDTGEMALDEMRKLLDTARAEYELIILDLGVLTAGRQSAVGSALADRAVLVAAFGCLRQEISTSQTLLDRLAPSRHLLVLNRASSLDPAFPASRVERNPIAVAGLKQFKNILKSLNGVKS
jgi:Mrp family chromosome partitioning ATPase/uncharacterized protein involved in exopolysaccharide biosynthesis